MMLDSVDGTVPKKKVLQNCLHLEPGSPCHPSDQEAVGSNINNDPNAIRGQDLRSFRFEKLMKIVGSP